MEVFGGKKLKNTSRLACSGQPLASLVLSAFVAAASLTGQQAAAQVPGGLLVPEQLELLPKVGLALSCTTYTRRVAEKAFLEKGEASLGFATVWFNASHRWLIEAADAGANRSDMAHWIKDVKSKPENTQIEDYCFKNGMTMLNSSSTDDKEMIHEYTQNELNLLRGRR